MPQTISIHRPVIAPLGESALLIRFADKLDDAANQAALALSAALRLDPIPGVVEVVPSLVSVLVRYDFNAIDSVRLAGEIGLRLGNTDELQAGDTHTIAVTFDGEDLAEVAATLSLRADDFVAFHNKDPLRVLTTGFAPGFVYCGFHDEQLVLPRRQHVRAEVPAGTVLFAAGQTAITATTVPTGWHVIGHTSFRNFDASTMPPTRLAAGDTITFEAIP